MKPSATSRAPLPPEAPTQAQVSPQVMAQLEALQTNIAKAVYGKETVVRQVVATLVAGGHLLIEDVPGVGKTTLAMALAQSIGGSHQRIQFTSDLLPSDILGVPIF